MANRKNRYFKTISNEMRKLFLKRLRIRKSLEFIKIIYTSTHACSLSLSLSSYNPIYLFWTSEIILEEDDFCCFI